MNRNPNLQELYKKFDGVGGDVRLAWYGQCRAKDMTHGESIVSTARRFPNWVKDVWPKREIEIPDDLFEGKD